MAAPLNGLPGGSIWDRLSRRVPELVVLCLIVFFAGWLNLRIAEANMEFQRTWLEQVQTISHECHLSHANVSLVLTAALDRNTDSISSLAKHEQATGVTMSALKTLVERMNGSHSRRGP